MKKFNKSFIFLLVAIFTSISVSANPDVKNAQQQHAPLSFIENKGQVTDQDLNQRPDIQFQLKAANGLSIFIGAGAIHYQFSKGNIQQVEHEHLPGSSVRNINGIYHSHQPIGSSFTMDRMDVELLGSNKNTQIITDEVQDFHEYHITADNIDKNGVIAHSYNRITYKDIYPNIDWVMYIKNGQLEHEFVVRQGGKVNDIQLKYGGAKDLKINADGSLTATTPQGIITEKAPVTYKRDGQQVASSFVINGSVLSYKTGAYTGELVIDPTLTWATYYGGGGDEGVGGLKNDGSANIYMTGYTTSISSVATSGAYQTIFAGGLDVYLARFNSSGAIQWATYYGGSDTDQALAITLDASGNVYITGMTKSTSGIATSGAYQTFNAGVSNVFLAKFNSSGAIQWATYYGGTGFDEGIGVTTDGSGNVFLTGTTTSASGIATVGAYLTALPGVQNAFLAEFSSSGILTWATYYGGEATDLSNGVAIDGAGNLYITGLTSSTTGIATSGAHQIINAGGAFDAFIARFTNTGALVWSTYYGGSDDDEAQGVATDPSGNVIVTGLTASLGTIASTGAYQTSLAGVYDAFVAKFNNAGVILWGTYYGGPNYDGAGSVITDAAGNIYFNGSTASTSGITTSGAIQATFGGGTYDGLLAEFSSTGTLVYGTYYGGTGDEYNGGVASDGTGNIYFAGSTTSTSSIATSGAYQTTYGGGPEDAFLVKVNICTYPVVAPITGTFNVCPGATTNLSDATTGGTWSSAFTPIATVGSTGIVTGVAYGAVNISYTVTNGCGTTAATQFVTVNVAPSAITITPATSATVCIGSGASFTASSSAPVSLLYQDFNSGMTGEVGGTWTIVNTGTSTTWNWGIYSPGSFTDVPGYTGGATLTGDGTYYMGSDPDLAGGSVSVNSILYSPVFSTVGYTGATLAYNYYLACQTPFDVTMEIDYSVDGGATWVVLNNYLPSTSLTFAGTTTWVTGTPNVTTVLPAAMIGQPNVQLRWNYNSNYGYWWAIDNVVLNATLPVSSYTWAGISGATGLSCTSCAATTITPTASGTNVYSVTATYGTCSVTSGVTVSVNPLPVVAAITGTTNVCVGSSVTLHDATSLGVWTSSAPGTASIGSSSGTVTGMAVGTATISYTVSNSCGNTSSTVNVTVVAAPGPITGTLQACVGGTSLLADGTSGGTWSSSAPGTASIGTTGLVTGNTPGNATITYSLGGTCTSTAIFTVNANPSGITPPGPVTVCVGANTSLGDVTAGGTWSSAVPATATVGTSGIVTGVAAGTVNILYTSAAGCAATKSVTVLATPAALSPSSASVCIGSTVTFTESSGGGTWSSLAPGTASVAGGVVTGVSAGTTSISYTIGTCAVGAPVTVNANPAAITPPGAVTMCVGATASLGDVTPGGTWSSAVPATATVGTSGIVTGVAAGTVNILYTSALGCSATKSVTVLVTPAALTPSSVTVCPGSTATFTESVGGGTWSSVAPATATIAAGMVTGVATGTTSISYTIGTCAVGAPVTVNAAPAGITPAAAVNICVGATASLGDITPGGTWSSASPGIATVGTSGTVTGVSAGAANISYTNGLGCAAVKAVNVLSTPAPLAPTSAIVCTGNTVAFTETVAGGIWSSSNGAVASVSAGLVTGLTVGTTNISYTIGTCAVGAPVTVNLSPNAGVITGPAIICAGSLTTYTDASPGGTWSSSNPAVATVGTSGAVTALTSGTFTLSYAVTNGCGTATATQVITVNATASAGTIIGLSTICAGTFTILVDTTSGGTWSATNSNATITATGLLTGIIPGTDTIKYSVTNACGTVSATDVVTIGPLLSAGTISGPSFVCVGSSVTLTDATGAGIWSASNSSAAVSGGIVTGVSAGVDTISYTTSASCGSAIATQVVTVVPIPAAGTIVGPVIVCAGFITTYTDAATGGVWGITNTSAAISGGGIVTALTPGTDTITYTVTNLCGSAEAEAAVSIGPAISAGTITGPGAVCAGAAITLTDPASGGIWSTSNGHATIIAGTVTGVSAGTDTVYYTVSGSCGSVSASASIVVNPLPSAGTVTGPSTLCIGTPATYTDAATGGSWSVSNSHAGITGGGLATPLTTGPDTVYYSVTNSCGTVSASETVTVMGALSAGTITGSGAVCAGTTITLTDGTPGGTWSASNGNATVSAGVVNGITAGVDTISYTVTGSCGSVSATKTVSVESAPAAGSITGPSNVCLGSPVMLTDGATGGAWSASNPTATVSTAGLVTAITPGTDTISYTVTNACGSAAATLIVAVSTSLPSAGSITGPSTVCAGSSITLADAITGGIWNSTNTSATVTGGTVTGVTPGMDTITYTVTNACGSAMASAPVTVGAALVTGTISGPAGVCIGSTITLTDAAPGGTWSSSNADATVSGGVVTGVSAGTSTISYTVSGSCGAASATWSVAVSNAPNAGTISGPAGVCAGSTITLTDATTGGTWSSSNTRATVSIGGAVTGLMTGLDTIRYSVTNGCGTAVASWPISVNGSPYAGSISGPSSVCPGATVSLVHSASGGTWSSSNTGLATVSSAGVVTGIASGTVTISYTLSNSCGHSSATHPMTVLSSTACGGTNTMVGGPGTKNGAELTVIPNPNNGRFTMKLTSDINEPVHVVITNLTGQKVQEFNTTTNTETEVEMSQAAGIYMLSASTSGGLQIAKIIVE